MTTERGKYVSTNTENGRATLRGVILISETRSYGYENEPEKMSSYQGFDLEYVDGKLTDIEQLAALADLLQNLPEDGAFSMDVDTLEEFLQEWASEIAEGAELPFTYTNRDGEAQTYTPASLWEASGSCSEWEQSAQYGYDYGWNI
jgi:hypothetical protein